MPQQPPEHAQKKKLGWAISTPHQREASKILSFFFENSIPLGFLSFPQVTCILRNQESQNLTGWRLSANSSWISGTSTKMAKWIGRRLGTGSCHQTMTMLRWNQSISSLSQTRIRWGSAWIRGEAANSDLERQLQREKYFFLLGAQNRRENYVWAVRNICSEELECGRALKIYS